MQQIAKHIAAAIIIAAISAATAADDVSPWRIDESVDEITDEKIYYVYSTGSKVGDELLHYRPDLVVRIIPKGLTPTGEMMCKPEIMIQLGDFDGVDRQGCDMILRYDKRKPVTETWAASTSRRAVFSLNDKKTLTQLKASTNLIVRFTTTLGHVRTSTFDVRGLTNALHAVKLKYLATNPPTIPDAKPSPPPSQPVVEPQPNSPSEFVSSYKPPPPCKKCKGKGTISGWVNCSGCGGHVMSGGSRCKKCIRSVRVGKVRGDIPCPECARRAQP